MTRRLLAAFAAVLLFVGCSDHPQTPLAPSAKPVDVVFATSSIDLTGVLEFATVPTPGSVRHASKLIRASEGGFVELNGFRVDIPAGALPHDATITIDLPSGSLLSRKVMAEFGPHGIQFNQPVTISFPLNNVVLPAGAIEVARWENGGWTSLGGGISADGKSLFSTTPHFSTYSARGKDIYPGG